MPKISIITPAYNCEKYLDSKISDKIYPTTQYLVAVDRLHFKLWHTLAHNARGF